MIVVIDNYDSFTYNLVQYLQMLGAEVKVVRNDAVTVSELASWNPAGIVISPGPCRPETAGISVEAIQCFFREGADSRGLSGPPGHRGGIWRRRGEGQTLDARQGVHRHRGRAVHL